LTDVTPKFHAAVRKDLVGPKATLPSMEEAVKEIDKAVKKAIKKGTSAKPKKR
jgi:D-aminopeptidase